MLGSFRSVDSVPSCLRSAPPGAAAGLSLASFRSRPAPPQDRSWCMGRRLRRRVVALGRSLRDPGGPVVSFPEVRLV